MIRQLFLTVLLLAFLSCGYAATVSPKSSGGQVDVQCKMTVQDAHGKIVGS